jgi:hypothetical protein
VKYLILILAISSTANARWLSLKESGSVVEKFNVEYEVFKNGAWNQTVEYVTRVQSEDAKANTSLFPIEYNAFTDTVEVLEAFTQNGKEKITVDPSAIEDRDKGESKDYDVQKVRSVVFPQVQIGSKLHIKYRIKTTKPLIEDRWSMQFSLGPGYYAIEKLSLKVKSEVPIFYVAQDRRDLVAIKQPTNKTLELKNIKLIPGWVHAEKDPVFHPGGNTEIFLSTHKEWPEFFTGLGAEYEKILNVALPKDMLEWTKQAAKKKTNPEKINFLMEKLSKDFRYFGDWRRHNGGFVPRPLLEISKSRYGDCKDLSALLTAMLRALKMEAQVALVRRGGNPWGIEPDYKLPGMNYFNHAVVHVQDGTKEYWLDPTNPVMSLKAYPDISGRPSWLLSGQGRFVRLPEARPEEFEHNHEYEYHFKDIDTVKVRVKADLKDLAPFDLSNDLMLSPRTAVLSDTLEYFSEGQEIKSHSFIVEPKTDRLLKDMRVDLEYEAGRVTFSAGQASFWVIPDGFLQGAFYETEDRESDLQLSDQPYLFKGLRRLKDTKLVQEAPARCTIDSDWMAMDRQVMSEGRDVLIRQSVSLKKPFITRAEFKSPAFKKLQEDTKRCFYRSGILIEPFK